MKVRVEQSRLTGHWVVNPGRADAQGFRRWADAMAAADQLVTRRLRRWDTVASTWRGGHRGN